MTIVKSEIASLHDSICDRVLCVGSADCDVAAGIRAGYRRGIDQAVFLIENMRETLKPHEKVSTGADPLCFECLTVGGPDCIEHGGLDSSF